MMGRGVVLDVAEMIVDLEWTMLFRWFEEGPVPG